MKKKLVLWIVLGVVLGFALSLFVVGLREKVKIAHKNIGRYQLFKADLTIYNRQNNSAEKGVQVFRIDTSTGKVENYFIGISKEGRLFQGWLDTENPFN